MTTHKMKIVISYIFLTSIILFSTPGCLEISAILSPVENVVKGITYWNEGEASRFYEEEPIRVFQAMKQTLEELEIPITYSARKNNTFRIVAGEKNRFDIWIMPKENSKLTKVTNRINYLGDKSFAELIYKKIDKQLDIIYYNK